MTLVWSQNSTNGRAVAGVDTLNRWALPRIGSARVARALDDWLIPMRTVPPPTLPDPAPGAWLLPVPRFPTHLAVRVWGSPGQPAVLLAHGWGGSSVDLHGVVRALVAAGLGAVTFDAPGHGRSAGDRLPLTDHAAATLAVAEAASDAGLPLVGAVGHGVGAHALVLARARGLALGRLVLLAATVDGLPRLLRLCQIHKLTPAETMTAVRMAEGVLGRPMGSLAVPALGTALAGTPVLFLHATDDHLVPAGDILHAAALWPGARTCLLDGVGHQGILEDPAAQDGAARFLCSTAGPAAG